MFDIPFCGTFSREVLVIDISGKIKAPALSTRGLFLLRTANLSPVANITQQIGRRAINSVEALQEYDQSKAHLTGDSNLKPYEVVGERSSRATKVKKVVIRDKDGNVAHVKASVSTNGETIYDQKYAEKIFNISNIDN